MEDRNDLLAEYLSGGLSPDEEKAFEARLEAEPDLKKEHDLMVSLWDQLKLSVQLQALENDPDLPRVMKELEEADKKAETRHWGVWKYTASAASIIGTALLLRLLISSVSALIMYDRFYEPIDRIFFESQMVYQMDYEIIGTGMDCYLSGDYECARDEFGRLPDAGFYHGMALLGLKEFDGAIDQLQEYLEVHPGYPAANWYLGLSYLKQKNPEEALDHLEPLLEEENPYSEQAEQLVRKLQKK